MKQSTSIYNDTPYDISVIIPVYNCEKYLITCLNSLKKQSFSNYELIIIDDCSTDTSRQLIQKFISENPCIKCIFKKNTVNRGACYSRNIGLNIASSEYICFLDSDDSYHSDFLKLLYEEIISKKTDIVFCGYDRCFENYTMKYTQTWKYPNYRNINYLKFNFLIGNTHICHCTVLYKKAFLLQKKLQYTEKCRHAGDTELIAKVLFNNPRFSCVTKSLYYYNIHENSITTKFPSKENFDAYYAYERIKQYIRNPLWKLLFILTKESREVFHIIEQFHTAETRLPSFFCSKYKIVAFLASNVLFRHNQKSLYIFKYFIQQYIRTK